MVQRRIRNRMCNSRIYAGPQSLGRLWNFFKDAPVGLGDVAFFSKNTGTDESLQHLFFAHRIESFFDDRPLIQRAIQLRMEKSFVCLLAWHGINLG